MDELGKIPRWLLVTVLIVLFAGLAFVLLWPVYEWPQPEPILIDTPMPY